MSEQETGLAAAEPEAETGLTLDVDSVGDVLANVPQNEFADETAMAKVTASSFPPYIKLFGGSSREVTRKLVEAGAFGLVQGKSMADIGNEFVCAIFAARPKAMVYKPKVASFYDPNSDVFKDIAATADQKDSNKGFGPEFLLWLPNQKVFAHLFLGNKTGRNEAASFMAVLTSKQYKCRVFSHLIETTDFSWHGPKVATYDHAIDMPSQAQLTAAVTKFNAPPKDGEILEEDKEGSDDR